MCRVLLSFFIQPMGKLAIHQVASAVPMYKCHFTPWHCPAAPIPINSSLSALIGSDTGLIEDANTAPHGFCQLLLLLLPLGMVLQPANWFC